MTTVKFEDNGDWEREIAHAVEIPRRLTNKRRLIVRKVSLDAMRRIKIRMPVDTGRAQNDWGTSIWEVLDGGLTIVQGSKLEYIEGLNEGNSKQAPAGFIDAEAERALDQLEKDLGDEIERLFR